jgi:alpha-methylacyl-CoA racemase
MPGPLTGIRIVEMAGIGPAPFAGMMLADHGADVIRIERPGASRRGSNVLSRSRRSLVLDLKQSAAIDVVRRVAAASDGLIEGFRPGVMERLGLGPETLLKTSPRFVYGRMTGWGQTGPYAGMAGHDINYIAVSGALNALGRAGEKPTPPINLIGDFGGGGMLLAFGMVSALLHARATGQGQVVDCAMTEGSSLLMSMFWGMVADKDWNLQRGTNLIDTGAHFYDTYETSDGKFVAIGAIEPQFYRELRNRLGIDDPGFDAQLDETAWPALKAKLAAIFKQRTRDEWCSLLEGTDACFAPVMEFGDAPSHPQMRDRAAFVTIGNVVQPAPAPRYSATQPDAPRAPSPPGSDADAVLRECGYSDEDLAELQRAKVLG